MVSLFMTRQYFSWKKIISLIVFSMLGNTQELFYADTRLKGCKQTGESHVFAQHWPGVSLLITKQVRITERVSPHPPPKIPKPDRYWKPPKPLHLDMSQPQHYHLHNTPPFPQTLSYLLMLVNPACSPMCSSAWTKRWANWFPFCSASQQTGLSTNWVWSQTNKAE